MLAVALLAVAAPFWETKSAAECTEEELLALLRDSPWSQTHQIRLPQGRLTQRANLPNPAVHVFLASAAPVRQAERELRRRRAAADPELAADSEYEEFLEANPGRYIVLAVEVARPELLEKEASVRKMENESRLKIDGRTYELAGHFPPTPGDPYLRLIFPRDVRDGDRELHFELYVPGVPLPFRSIRFELDKLRYRGRPEL
jgi:hypothetical protein